MVDSFAFVLWSLTIASSVMSRVGFQFNTSKYLLSNNDLLHMSGNFAYLFFLNTIATHDIFPKCGSSAL